MKKPKKCYDILCMSVLQQIVSKKESKCENNLSYYSNGSLSAQVCAVFSPNCLGALFCQVKVRIDPNLLLVHFQRWKSRSAARVCELAFVVVLHIGSIQDLLLPMLQLGTLKMSTSEIFSNRFISLNWKLTICILSLINVFSDLAGIYMCRNVHPRVLPYEKGSRGMLVNYLAQRF